jgi:group I intron endonuclease
MSEITIYALIDPNTDQIRYVGKTKHCPKKRLQAHLYEKSKTYKCNWIKSLNGKIPELLILDIVSEDNWIFWEQYWISQCKCWGFQLTNATIGGEGGSGLKYSEERKKQISNSNKGRIVSEETRLKISIGNKGKQKSEKHCRNLSISHKGKAPKTNKRFCRKIIQLDDNFNFIKEWNSLKEAATFYNVNQSSISHCCAGRKAKIKGFIWKYKTDYEK